MTFFNSRLVRHDLMISPDEAKRWNNCRAAVAGMVAASAQHSLGLWVRSGACRVKDVPAVPYPDERYRTELLLWDRELIEKRSVA